MLKKRIAAVLTCLALAAAMLPMSVMAVYKTPANVWNLYVTGNVVRGGTLTAHVDVMNAEEAKTITYQWYYCTTNLKPVNRNFKEIDGAASAEYTIPEDFTSLYITCEVTITRPTMGNTTLKFRSSVLGPIATKSETAAPPKALRVMTTVNYDYQGAKKVDSLFVTYAYQDVNGEEEEGTVYQWMYSDMLNGTYQDIPAATERIYKVTEEDIRENRFFKCKVTPKNANGEGDTVTSWGMGVSNLALDKDVNIRNGYSTSGSEYGTFKNGSKDAYGFKGNDGDYDSFWGFGNYNATQQNSVNLGEVKTFDTLVIYAGYEGEQTLFNSSLWYSNDASEWTEIPIRQNYVNAANKQNQSYFTSAYPVEVHFPPVTAQYVMLQQVRPYSTLNELQVYNTQTDPGMIECDLPEHVKIPVGAALPVAAEIFRGKSLDGKRVITGEKDFNVTVIEPEKAEGQGPAAGDIYQYVCTVRDESAATVQMKTCTVELVDAETQPVEVTAAFGDGETALTAVQKGNNRVTVTAVNDLFVEASVQPVVGLFNGDRLEAAQIGEKAALKAGEKTYTFDFSVEDPAGRSIRVLAWKDLTSMEPLQVTNGRLPAPQK